MFKSLKTKVKAEVGALVGKATAGEQQQQQPRDDAGLGSQEKDADPIHANGDGGHNDSIIGTPSKTAYALSPEDQAYIESLTRADLESLLTKRSMQVKKYQTKMADLVAAYKEVTQTKEKLESTLEKQQDTSVRRAREANESHKADLAAKDKMIISLQSSLEEQRAENQQLQDDIDNIQKSLSETKESLEKVNADYDNAMSKIATTQQELEDQKEFIAHRETELKTLKTFVATQTSELDEQKKRIQELDLNLREKEIGASAQSQLVDQVKLASKESTAIVEEQRGRIAELEQSLGARKAAVVRLESSIAGLESRLSTQQRLHDEAMQEQEESLLQRISRIEEQLTQANDDKQMANDQLAQAQTSLQNCTRESQHYQQLLEEERSGHAESRQMLEKRLAMLQEKDSKVQEEVTHQTLLQEQLEELQNRHERLKGEKNAKIAQLHEEVEVLTKTNLSLETTLARERDSASNANQNLQAKADALDSANSTIKKLTKQLDDVHIDLHAAQADLASRDELLEEMKRTNHEKGEQLSSLHASRDELQKSISIKTEEAIEFKARIETLTDTLDVKSRNLEEIQETLAKSQVNVKELTQQLEESALQIKEMTVQADALNISMNKEKEQAEKLKSELSRAQQEKEEASSQLAELESTNKAISNKQDEITNGLVDAEARAKESEEEIARLKQQISELEATASENDTKLTEANQEIQNLNDKLSVSEEDRKAADLKSQDLNTMLAESKENVEVLSEKLAAAEKSRDTVADTLNAEIEVLQREKVSELSARSETESQLELLNQMIHDLNLKGEDLEEQLLETRKRLTKSEEECHELSEKHVSTEEALTTVTQERDNLLDSVNSLEQTAESLNGELESQRITETELRGEITKLNENMEATVAEHQKASKLQAQHAAELKKTLQRQLRTQSTSSLAPGESPATTAATTGPPKPKIPGDKKECVFTLNGREVNVLYLKNILLKYMTHARNTSESRQFLKVLSTLLQFNKKEVKMTMDYLEKGWFG